MGRQHKVMQISIVISTYNHLDDCLKPCLDSIFKNTELEAIATNDIEIIVVANGCKDGTRKYLENEYAVKTLWFDEALGFPRANNEGIKAATGDYIVLLNNDTILLPQRTNDWIRLLSAPFYSDPKVGLTATVKFTFKSGNVQRDAVAFWCVMIKREVFDKIGYLDEVFNPFGCEDIDFSCRAVDAGYKLVQVPNDLTHKFLVEQPTMFFPIYHAGSTTTDEHKDKSNIESRNMKIIYERYGQE